MDISYLIQESILVITIDNHYLDASISQEFKRKASNLIDQTQIGNVVLDLGKLDFIDSSGLGSFLSILRKLVNNGGDIKLAKLTDPIRMTIELIRMHKIIDVFNTTDQAIRSFNHVANRALSQN